MQQTENYKLNLIESTDTFSPDPLNENAQATERELLAVRGEFAAADAELQAAVQSAQSAASSALSAHAADTTQHALVKLGTMEVPANTTGTFSISDPENYRMLISSVWIKGGSTTRFQFNVNGVFAGIFEPDHLIPQTGTHGLHCLMTLGSYTCGLIISSSLYDAGRSVYFGCPTAWKAPFTISYIGCDVDASVTVYGLKA